MNQDAKPYKYYLVLLDVMRFEDGFFKFVSGENEMTSIADAWLVHQNSLSIFKGDDFEN